MRYFPLFLIGLIAGCNPSGETMPSDTPAEVMIHDGWVRAVEDVSAGTAAYFILHNGTESDRVLIAVETEIAERAELHESRLEDGLLRMRPVDNIPVASNSSVELAPGGYHVMLLDLHQPFSTGDLVGVTLHFDDGTILDERLPVQSAAGDHTHHH